jgi:hypothetical protein
MEDKKDIRENYYYHPEYGVVTENGAGGYYYQHARVHDSKDGELESIYNHARRAWVEEAMLKELVEADGLLNSSQVEKTTQYFCEAYDVIQKTISNFQTNK